MRIYTVLCIVEDVDAPQVVVSNFVDLDDAKQKFDDYEEADKAVFKIVPEDFGDFEALNTVLGHFTALDPETEEKIEEVFLIETEE